MRRMAFEWTLSRRQRMDLNQEKKHLKRPLYNSLQFVELKPGKDGK